MGKNWSKYEAALAFIAEREWLRARVPRAKVMKYMNLYAALAAAGVVWSIQDKAWHEKSETPVLAASPTVIATRTSARRDKVLMRIITHKAVRDLVLSEIVELVEALNYTIESTSRAYKNADGDFVRTYINLRRNNE